MIVTTKDLFKHAYGKYAVGAYNINNLEQTVGLFRGNLGKKDKNEEPTNPATSAPFIIQISRGARAFTDKRFLEAMIRSAEDVFPEAIFAVHLDHGTEEVCYECIDSGFYSSVMIDASHDPFDKNIEITRRVVDRAHDKGLSVEAELGMLGGVEEDISVDADHACLTDPDQAVEFVERSGCDSLAVAIGTSHGAFKFKGKQSLHFDRIEAIQKLLPKFPLVMHGSSSVPQEWVDRINAAGGNLPQTSGVQEQEYLPAAKLGVTKVNIDTDGRLIWCAVYREVFRDKPADFDPRSAGKPFMAAYADFITHKNKMLGSAGQLESVRKSLGVAV
ncbi:MAG: class II fructose-bisphosphate aldolase [Planctomycetaceae bacterium]|nr:class II fructose-bisphosphate aldolase [Planctomycetaceae bacterium]